MRIAVTGAAGDFGTAILRALVSDGRATELIGIDVAPLRVEHDKLRAELCDVRSPRLGELLAGCEAVIHLAFILIPGHDRDEAHSINQDGSENVVERAAQAGVRRLVVASSLSAHGAPRKGQPAVHDATAAEADPGHFYFREKAEVEAMLDRRQASSPGRPPVITRLRPGFVYGPDFSNPALEMMGSRLAVVPDDGGRTQLVHQDDLAAAFCAAAFEDVPGAFLLVTEDSIALEDLARLSGGRVLRVPKRAARIGLDVAHALRLSPISGDWAVSGDRVGTPGAAREALGFAPALSSRESALVVLAQHGRRLRYADGLPSKRVAERMLEIPTRLILEARERNPALARLDLEGELERLDHEWVPYRGQWIHLERHDADPDAATFVVAPGLGDHARRHLGLATALSERGLNSLLVDRQGHGLSEGRRGDAPLEADLAVLELAIERARSRSTGPVILLGDSLGGIMSWYLLTREPDVEAAVCHCIGHPEVHHDPSFGPPRAAGPDRWPGRAPRPDSGAPDRRLRAGRARPRDQALLRRAARPAVQLHDHGARRRRLPRLSPLARLGAGADAGPGRDRRRGPDGDPRVHPPLARPRPAAARRVPRDRGRGAPALPRRSRRGDRPGHAVGPGGQCL